jgi:hypothetical protein
MLSIKAQMGSKKNNKKMRRYLNRRVDRCHGSHSTSRGKREKKKTLFCDDFFVIFDGIFIVVLTQDVRVK